MWVCIHYFRQLHLVVLASWKRTKMMSYVKQYVYITISLSVIKNVYKSKCYYYSFLSRGKLKEVSHRLRRCCKFKPYHAGSCLSLSILKIKWKQILTILTISVFRPLKYGISVSITVFVSEIRWNYATFPFSLMKIGQFPTSIKKRPPLVHQQLPKIYKI